MRNMGARVVATVRTHAHVQPREGLLAALAKERKGP